MGIFLYSFMVLTFCSTNMITTISFRYIKNYKNYVFVMQTIAGYMLLAVTYVSIF
jgi:hypothetical protein